MSMPCFAFPETIIRVHLFPSGDFASTATTLIELSPWRDIFKRSHHMRAHLKADGERNSESLKNVWGMPRAHEATLPATHMDRNRTLSIQSDIWLKSLILFAKLWQNNARRYILISADLNLNSFSWVILNMEFAQCMCFCKAATIKAIISTPDQGMNSSYISNIPVASFSAHRSP